MTKEATARRGKAGPCPSGKVTYRERFRADLAKARNDELYERESSVYQCPDCGYWHLTTHPYPEKRERRLEVSMPRKYRLPGRSCKGWAPRRGILLFEMPAGCAHSGWTFVFPAKMTSGVDYDLLETYDPLFPEVVYTGGGDIVLNVAETWGFYLEKREGGKLVDSATLTPDGFGEELARSHGNGRIADPTDRYEIQKVEAAAKSRAKDKNHGKEVKDMAKQAVNAGVRGTAGEDAVGKAVAFHEKFPDIPAAEVAAMVGLDEGEVERAWEAPDPEPETAAGDAADLALRMSQLNEEVIATRNAMLGSCAGATLADIWKAQVKANMYLDIIATVLVESQDPGYGKTKAAHASLKDSLDKTRRF